MLKQVQHVGNMNLLTWSQLPLKTCNTTANIRVPPSGEGPTLLIKLLGTFTQRATSFFYFTSVFVKSSIKDSFSQRPVLFEPLKWRKKNQKTADRHCAVGSMTSLHQSSCVVADQWTSNTSERGTNLTLINNRQLILRANQVNLELAYLASFIN